MGEFQSFCTVKCHQDHIVLILVQTVDVSDEGNFLEEPAQRRLFAPVLAVLLIRRRLIDKLVDILDPGLRLHFVFRFQALHISGLLYDLPKKVRDALFLCLTFEIFYQRREGIQL